MRHHDHRRGRKAKLRRREHPAMARDQLAILGHEARHRPAELEHAGGDSGHLFGAVLLGITRIGAQPLKRPVRHLIGREGQVHFGSVSAGLAPRGWLRTRKPGWIPAAESTRRHGTLQCVRQPSVLV